MYWSLEQVGTTIWKYMHLKAAVHQKDDILVSAFSYLSLVSMFLETWEFQDPEIHMMVYINGYLGWKKVKHLR